MIAATANQAPDWAALIVPAIVYGPMAVAWAVIRRKGKP